MGLEIQFSNGQVKWIDKFIPMKAPDHWQNHTNYSMALDCDVLDIYDDNDVDDAFIMDAKYDATSDKTFDGQLGHYKHEKVHLELIENAQPVFSKAYSVPKQHGPAFLKELKHLQEIAVLEQTGPSEWASPTFIIPKKDSRVRWISHLRQLNKNVKRKVYPLPLIDDIVARCSGYKYFTKLDLTMMFYSFELDELSKKLCTINTQYGLYQYNRMAMGLKPAPDLAQYYLEKTLCDLKEKGVEIYIDDVSLFSNSYEEHMALIQEVLQQLQAAGFKINPLKCEWWCVQVTDFLGHWLTPDGVKPWKKKIDAILKMSAPTNVTELRAFLGAVTFYRHMWPRRSPLLKPLTELTGKGMFEWTDECAKAFAEMKAIMASNIMMCYPNPNKPFEIYTDAPDHQMGAVIMQGGKPVAYWSRKLNAAQRNYSVMEKEMLAVVHCLKEFQSMVYGAKLTI
ncbi:unnamed protein product [Cylindrotheca closterium]|uniref:Reverse transcriptase domain-containing protein n=1 Tax=Cylindrotheca closterium TaxID=2856 RepID=A0AAD2FJC0_9STRA|nr:unnamed protein product [Cylindrotheca closterium]